MLAKPFAALRPSADTASAVIAPPYDVVDTDEARSLAAARSESFLHISRPEIDLPPGTDPYDDAVYAQGAENLSRLVETGVLERERTPCYYIYRLTTSEHMQTGIAFGGSVTAYESGRIHPHELTRPDKETDRVRNIESLNAQTGPVLLAYKANAELDARIARLARGVPLFAARGQHDVLHTIWRVDDAAEIDVLSVALDALGELYIADGHHRSAAAARVAAARRGETAQTGSKRSGSAPDASHESFLSVAFADDQMLVFDYNRVVRDLNGLGEQAFLAAVADQFQVELADAPAKPEAPKTFGMYFGGRWYRLQTAAPGPANDPVGDLDVSLLQDRLIAPILGVGDPRTDPRIGFVGGVRGLGELERRVDSGAAAVAFALYPTSMRQLMAVADAGLLMPPKSTWFEPKLADGLLSHVLD